MKRKRLYAMEMINWHNIGVNPWILKFGEYLTGITGANASGKTTVLDAINTVLFVRIRNYSQTTDKKDGKTEKRDLVKYIRAKDAVSDTFFRTGTVTSHIAIEILDEETDIHYVVGVEFHIAAGKNDNQDIEKHWYMVMNCSLQDLLYTEHTASGIRVKRLEEVFRTLDPKSYVIFQTEQNAKAKYAQLFGLTNARTDALASTSIDTWVSRMDKIQAYKPDGFGNANKFIADTVLGSSKIAAEGYFDHIHTAQETKELFTTMQEKCSDLADIIKADECYLEEERKRIALLNICTELHHREKKEDFDKKQYELQKIEDQIAQIEAKIAYAKEQYETYRSVARDMQENNDVVREMDILRENIEKKQKTVLECEQAKAEMDSIMLKLREVSDDISQHTGKPCIPAGIFENYAQEGAVYDEDFYSIKEHLKQTKTELEDEKTSGTIAYTNCKETLKTVTYELDAAEKGQVVVNHAVDTAKKIIADTFVQRNITDTPYCLYELLEYEDASWAKAVESYMGNEKFTIIVQPQNYITAAYIIDDYVKTHPNVRGISIADLSDFDKKYQICEKETLPTVFSCENEYLRCYLNYKYGRVYLTDNAVSPENKDGFYLTKNGELYGRRKHTILRLNDSIIGRKAREEKIIKLKEQKAELEEQIRVLSENNSLIKNLLSKFEDRSIRQLFYGDDINRIRASISDLVVYGPQLIELQHAYENFEKSDVILKYEHTENLIETAKKEQMDLSRERDNRIGEKGKILQSLDDIRKELEESAGKCADLETENPYAYNEAKQSVDKLISDHHGNIHRAHDAAERKLNHIRTEELKEDIIRKQSEYIASDKDCTFGTAGHSSMPDYYKMHEALTKADLPNLSKKAEQEYKQAKAMMYQDILGKLAGNIAEAKEQLSKLNRALSQIPYKGTIFQFSPVTAAIGKELYFDALLAYSSKDPFSVLEGNDLTADQKATIDELIELINQSFEKKDKDKAPDYLDYRTYCKFNLMAQQQDGVNRITIDKWIGLGSGSGVQIPFYVIMLTTLYMLYGKDKSGKGNSALRIAFVDEAFQKSDCERIRTLLNFVRDEMNIQLIALYQDTERDAFIDFCDAQWVLDNNDATHTRICVPYLRTPETGLLVQDTAEQ